MNKVIDFEEILKKRKIDTDAERTEYINELQENLIEYIQYKINLCVLMYIFKDDLKTFFDNNDIGDVVRGFLIFVVERLAEYSDNISLGNGDESIKAIDSTLTKLIYDNIDSIDRIYEDVKKKYRK